MSLVGANGHGAPPTHRAGKSVGLFMIFDDEDKNIKYHLILYSIHNFIKDYDTTLVNT